jgi:Transposase and inactivated derivatives
MKYRFMSRYGSGFTVRKMCRVLGVNRSGYYAYLRRGLSRRREEDSRLVNKIREIWVGVRGVYGAPRITAELRARGDRHGKNRIARLMRENGIKARTGKRFKITTRSDHGLPVAPDLVGRDFSARYPDEIWLSDITYIWTWEGWLYLSVVMDVFNREIVGWALHDRLKKDLVVTALHKAFVNRDPQPGLIFHADRGSQYASHEVGKILEVRGIRQSMCGKGNCYDNAMMESFFSSLKKELVRLQTFHSRSQAHRSIFDYIEIFYNRQRRHSALNYMSPVEYYREATQT